MLLVDHQIRALCVEDGVPRIKAMIEPFSEAISGDGVIS